MGSLDELDYSINEVLSAKKQGSIPSEGTKYADIKLNYYNHPITHTTEPKQFNFRCTKEKVDILISGKFYNCKKILSFGLS